MTPWTRLASSSAVGFAGVVVISGDAARFISGVLLRGFGECSENALDDPVCELIWKRAGMRAAPSCCEGEGDALGFELDGDLLRIS